MAIRKYPGPYHVFHVSGGWQIWESVGKPHRLWMELRPIKIYDKRRSAYARCTRLNQQHAEQTDAWLSASMP